MRFSFVACAVGLWAGLAAAQERGPRLVLDQREVAFGEVLLGQTRELSVGFRNAGDAPLILSEVEPSCGCTLSEFPRAAVPPGGSGTLAFVFDSHRRLGPQALTVKIYSNDPSANELGQGCTILHLRGQVRSLFQLRPAGAFFGEWVRGAAPETRVVHVSGVDEARGRALEGRLATALPGYLRASVRPWTTPAGEPGLEVEVQLQPDAPLGDLDAPLVLETGLPEQPTLEVPVIGVVSGRVGGPSTIQFEGMARGWGATRRVPLERRDGGEGVGILRLEFDPAYFTVKREAINPSREDLVVHVKDDVPPGAFAKRLRVHLADPNQPVFDVVLFGHVAPTIQVDPPLAVLVPGAPTRLRVRGGEVRVARLEPAVAGAEVTLEGEGGEHRVHVTLPAQAQLPQLVLETSHPGEERVVVPLRWAE